MAATTFDLIGGYAIERGFAWSFGFRRLQRNRHPVDLTSLTARLEIFNTQRERGTPLSYPTETTLGADGWVTFRLTGTETRAIAATAGRYRIIFRGASGEETVFLRGRLAILEPPL